MKTFQYKYCGRLDVSIKFFYRKKTDIRKGREYRNFVFKMPCMFQPGPISIIRSKPCF